MKTDSLIFVILIFLAAIVFSDIANVSLAENGICGYRTITRCSEYPGITRDACDKVISFAREYYGGCSGSEVSIEYNVDGLECGDELSLRIARYLNGDWKIIEETTVIGSGDGSGIATAMVDSDGIYAVVANENCVKECKNNVFDVPDPVLLDNEITLGVCGLDKFKEDVEVVQQGEIEDFSIEKADNIAPVIFVIRRDECTENMDLVPSPTWCPANYAFAGSFKYGVEDYATGSLNDYIYKESVEAKKLNVENYIWNRIENAVKKIKDIKMGKETVLVTFEDDSKIRYDLNELVMVYELNFVNDCSADSGSITALGPDLKPRSLLKGWINFCTKNDNNGKELAYLEVVRNDCVFSEQPGNLVNTATVGKKICPVNSVVCGISTDGFKPAGVNSYSCCGLSEINVGGYSDTLIKESIAGANGEDAYCDSGVASSILLTSKSKDSRAFYAASDIECSELDKASAGTYKVTGTSPKPNYALCGTRLYPYKNSNYAGEFYFCSIEQDQEKQCKDGYELVGSIRVGRFDENRCDSYYQSKDDLNAYFENGISKDGKRIEAGLMGLCVKKQGTSNIDDLIEQETSIAKPAIFAAYDVELGEAEENECDNGYHKLASIQNKDRFIDDSLLGVYLDFAYAFEEEGLKGIKKGKVGLCVADNKPRVFFCPKDEFNEGICGDETEYCRDENGAFECKHDAIEEGEFDYYAFVCDFFGCPSPNYKSNGKSYYGKESFVSCSMENCGYLQANDITPDIVPETELPPYTDEGIEEENNCVDSDEDGFFVKDAECTEGNDCDDSNKEIHPGVSEVCGNDIDEDCSSEADICEQCDNGKKDEDLDGTCSDIDCNDNNATISPNAIDVCSNNVDENCDGKDSICPECKEGDIAKCYLEKEDYFYTYNKACSKDGIYGKCRPDYEINLNPLNPMPSCIDGELWSCPRQFGVCQGAKTECTDSKWPGCDYGLIEGYSITETCDDGLDNNCDGSIDEGCFCNNGDTKECGSTVGECKLGKQTCSAGKWGKCDFSNGYYPKPEYLFDEKDNNCDGSIDEGFACGSKYQVGFNRRCGDSNIAPCSYGKQYCTNQTFMGFTIFGECTNSVEPGNEICDEKDNDCDGSTDEGCSCDNGQTKSCGIGVGICDTGRQECVNGTFGVCNNVKQPEEEKCQDSLDNNCDGSIDEGCPCIDSRGNNVTSRACSLQNGVCSGFNQTCENGVFKECDYSKIVSYEAIESKCDDLFDNDCDGKTDELDINCGSTSNAKCYDGTVVGDCSGSKLCTNDAQLENKCEICDNCDSGSEYCSKGVCVELRKTGTYCGDGSCDNDETNDTCPQDCQEGNKETEAYCGDGSCDNDETNDTCPQDCAAEKGFPWWILYLFVALSLIFASLLIYRKYSKEKIKKKKDQMPEFRTILKPSEISHIEKPIEVMKEERANIHQLEEYVKRSLENGKKDNEIRNLCMKSGWSNEEVDNAIKKAKPDVSRKEALNKLYAYVDYQFKKETNESLMKEKLLRAGWNKTDVEKAINSSKNAIREMQRRKLVEGKIAEDEKYADKRLKEMIGEDDALKKDRKKTSAKRR